jgi:DNA repair exonuclease SbcCD ATPase subunit
MNTNRKITVAVVVLIILFLASLGIMGYQIKQKHITEQALASEMLKSENLLSEKLDLSKQLKSVKDDMLALQGKNKELDQFLAEANQKVTAKEQTISRLVKENASLQAFKKENEEIKKMREELYYKVEQLSKTNTQLTKELEGLNKTLAGLKEENSKLTAELNSRSAKPATSNFRMESLKKRNDKLTVKARKTNSVMVSFDIENGDKANYEKYRLILRRPEGGDIAGEQKVTFSAAPKQLVASTQESLGQVSRDRVNIAFTPSQKLEQGIYTLFIYDGNTLLGSAQVRLIK